MIHINLSRFLSQKDNQSVINKLSEMSSISYSIRDLDDNFIMGDESIKGPKKFAIKFSSEIIGWVYGGENAETTSIVVNYAVNKEAEKKILAADTLQKYKELNLLHEISEKLARCINIDDVIYLVLNRSQTLIKDYENAQLGIVLEDGDKDEMVQYYTQDKKNTLLKKTVKQNDGIIANILSSGKAEIINDVFEDPRFEGGMDPIRSIMCAPLRSKERVFGTVIISSNRQINYNAGELDLLVILASQAALSIENTILHQKQIDELSEMNVVLEEKIRERTRELTESEERYRFLVEFSPDLIFVIKNKKIVFINSAANKYLSNNNISQIIDRNFIDFIHPNYHESCIEQIQKLNQQGDFHPSIDVKLCDLNNKVFDMEIASALINFENEAAILSICRDISHRKRIERLKEDTERMVRHDLKNPLNGIIGLSELMKRDDNLTERQNKWIGQILDNSNKIFSMIEQSFKLFQIEEGNYQLCIEDVDFIDLLQSIDENNINLRESKEISIQYYLDDEKLNWTDKLLIQGERVLYEIMLSNLIKNALEASPEKEVISIRLDRSEDYFLIEIHNKGCIPESIRDRFFERYVTYGKTAGVGMGSYSSKLIANAHGGSISFKTDNINGTTLIIKVKYRQDTKGMTVEKALN